MAEKTEKATQQQTLSGKKRVGIVLPPSNRKVVEEVSSPLCPPPIQEATGEGNVTSHSKQNSIGKRIVMPPSANPVKSTVFQVKTNNCASSRIFV